MGRIAVVTDSNSGITQKKAEELEVFVIPMPFYIEGKMYLEDITLSQEEFYEKLSTDAQINTSQPAPLDITELWDKLLKDYDEVVHIPMSSGLSASCDTAYALAQDYDGKVHVVNNQRISVTQYQSVLDALTLAGQGRTGEEIKATLEKEKFESSIYIMVETLKYLKRGGRVTPAAAAIGAVLNIKPVLQIQGEKLDAFAKVRGSQKAKKVMIDALTKDFETRFVEYHQQGKMVLQAAYAGNREEAEQWKQEIEAAFPGMDCHMDPLSLSIACHVGPGILALACSKRVDE